MLQVHKDNVVKYISILNKKINFMLYKHKMKDSKSLFSYVNLSDKGMICNINNNDDYQVGNRLYLHIFFLNSFDSIKLCCTVIKRATIEEKTYIAVEFDGMLVEYTDIITRNIFDSERRNIKAEKIINSEKG